MAAKLQTESVGFQQPSLSTDDALHVLANERRQKGRGQGFQVSPKVRKALEEYAMKKAEDHFRSIGYEVTVVGKPYDLRCVSSAGTLYVEVKGTTTKAAEVLLTPNEVVFAREHVEQIALFVVYDVKVSGIDDKPTVTGGKELLIQPWNVDSGTLEPVGYSYTLPPDQMTCPR